MLWPLKGSQLAGLETGSKSSVSDLVSLHSSPLVSHIDSIVDCVRSAASGVAAALLPLLIAVILEGLSRLLEAAAPRVSEPSL